MDKNALRVGRGVVNRAERRVSEVQECPVGLDLRLMGRYKYTVW